MGTTEGQDLVTYDVLVVGGGAAGLSGALTRARARRSVLVVDGGEPRNAPASGVHGFLTRDGVKPSVPLGAGREEVRGYGAELLDRRVASAERDEDGIVEGHDEAVLVGARRLLFATGLIDELPDVQGVRERWGRDVLHCPYCHGWEVRDRPIGVLALNSWAAHQALLFRQWSASVTLFLHDAPRPTDEEAERLAARGIAVVEGEVASLEVVEDRLTGIRLRDGEVFALLALALMPRVVARTEMFEGLGLETTGHPSGLGEQVEADATGLTAVPGVWVAGNVADLAATVVGAAGAGVRVGAAINADLIAEDTDRAVTAHHARRGAPTVGGG